MDQLADFSEADWVSYSRMFSIEEPDFGQAFPSTYFPTNVETDIGEMETYQSVGFPGPEDVGIMDDQTTAMLSHLFADVPMVENEMQTEDSNMIDDNADQPHKRLRLVGDGEKKRMKQKRDNKSTSSEHEPLSFHSYSSSDDASQDSSTKGRASRGSATDPQSLYARKRRERINERLRILQNLVPNGTKVDISTMLEEAVHYVKFLQLQIKLLSSDDHWMYAPIAYNGVDIGVSQKISMLL